MKAKTLILLTAIASFAFIRPAPAAPNVIKGDNLQIGTSGGLSHNLGGTASSIAGGDQNKVAADNAFIGAGQSNTNTDLRAVIGGGWGNSVTNDSYDSFIGAGAANILNDAHQSSIVGGSSSKILQDSYASFIGGGYLNSIYGNAPYSAIDGGTYCVIGTNSAYGWVGGGWGNVISNDSTHCVIGGGNSSIIYSNSSKSVIGGGQNNQIYQNSGMSIITGGGGNVISNNCPGAIISGGGGNTIRSNSNGAIITGGDEHYIGNNAPYAAVLGGWASAVLDGGAFSTIVGGYANYCHGAFSTVAGGYGNICYSSNSLVAGYGANAQYHGSFVWSDDSNLNGIYSSVANEFVVAASGGIWLGTKTAAFNNGTGIGANHFIETSTGAYLTTAGSWSCCSDRNLKRDFRELSSKDVLDKVANLPITSWSYKAEDQSVRHIGPMAQDFYAAFHLGQDDKHITSLDEDGVALAAIQALYQVVKEKDQQIQDLQKQISSLKKQVAAQENINSRWEERFVALEKAVARKSSPVLTVSNTSENR